MLILRFNLFNLIILSRLLSQRLILLIILNRLFLIMNKITSIKSSVMAIGTIFAFTCLMLWFLFRCWMCDIPDRFAGCGLYHLLATLFPSLFDLLSHGSRLVLLFSGLLWHYDSVLLLSRSHIITPTATSIAASARSLRLILSTGFLPLLIFLSLLFFVKKILRLYLSRVLNSQMHVKLTVRTVIAILASVVPVMRTLFFG